MTDDIQIDHGNMYCNRWHYGFQRCRLIIIIIIIIIITYNTTNRTHQRSRQACLELMEAT